MRKRITAYRTRTNLGEVLSDVYYRGATYVVTRRGKTVALVSPPFLTPARRRRGETAIDRRRRTLHGLAGSLTGRDGAVIARTARASRREAARLPIDLDG